MARNAATDMAICNDLWRYDPATWHVDVDERRQTRFNRIRRHTALRACRMLPICPVPEQAAFPGQTVTGNLWLFGGYEYVYLPRTREYRSEHYNDLWRYDHLYQPMDLDERIDPL